ncbi:WD-40 repeat-containing protein [Reticulomyxa filosa]|uniref:WD-40 repeat-containing protein n=1 Tax=Reticulomyxa filosa TaxID=46433 RepID=X6L7V6_RETFI|nr:WD-40 repeat-containing protein [Reticulomyxa filosa]|eukprot:ETN97106.1 WD-40 repeat-containing protein [Reticulomyxa filosa]
MTAPLAEKQMSPPILVIFILSLESSEKEKVEVIIRHWIQVLNIKLGWIHDFDEIIFKFVILSFAMDIFMFDIFHSSQLLNTFSGHTNRVTSVDYSTFDGDQFICSSSADKTVRVWDLKTDKQIQLISEYSSYTYCVKFSTYHRRLHRNVICFSSFDKTILFWDIKNNRQLQAFDGHGSNVFGIELSQFSGGRYLCSGSHDKTIYLWDIETCKSLHVFNGHTHTVWCVDFSPLQSNNNNSDKSNSIGVIGGNGYTICSGSWDKTIRIWDIETTEQSIVFEGHKHWIMSVKYGSNELGNTGGANTILSGSIDQSVRLWDIRSGQQIQVFNGHTRSVTCVEYSPFVVDSIEVGDSSNVICSGSLDNTIRFWDIRSNKNALHVMNDKKDGDGVQFVFGDKMTIFFKILVFNEQKKELQLMYIFTSLIKYFLRVYAFAKAVKILFIFQRKLDLCSKLVITLYFVK